MASYVELLCGLVVLAVAFYYYLVWNFDFWRKRGIPGPEPHLFFGTHKDLIFAKVCVAHVVEDLYRKYRNAPAVGLYNGRSPVLVLHDPELIRTILIKDFTNFADRPQKPHARTEPLSLNLFQLDSVRWRLLRPKLTPMFTSGKLKGMFGLMVECSENFDKYLDHVVMENEVVEVLEATAKYTTDVIGSCAFGINMNTMGQEDSEFREKGKLIFEGNIENAIRLKLRLFLPGFYDLLGFVFPDKRLAPFFTKIVTETMNYRRQNNVYRPDFIHLLMELWDNPERTDSREMTDQLLIAQAYSFFSAGFETSSSAMSWALLELAQNHEIQEKLHQEIKEYMKKYNGEIDYTTMKEMEYLDKVFRETLRKYPPAALLLRTATTDYTFETLNLSIPKSTEIWIPMFAIQRDPAIYPDPLKFDPERFTKEAIATRHPMYHLSFGDGPRNCIGNRFAIFQTKLGLLRILLRYKVDICEKTKLPCEFDPNAWLLSHKGGIYLKMTKIE
ncbi:putative cytochrome P450 6a13 [Megalopta genalis]|uniref:putative cytochrome P450 6a13 n=1 Tax=Megalopta genalis TaxID=115081 RepID=UPI003FD4B38D